MDQVHSNDGPRERILRQPGRPLTCQVALRAVPAALLWDAHGRGRASKMAARCAGVLHCF
jgi:hypothetical protein